VLDADYDRFTSYAVDKSRSRRHRITIAAIGTGVRRVAYVGIAEGYLVLAEGRAAAQANPHQWLAGRSRAAQESRTTKARVDDFRSKSDACSSSQTHHALQPSDGRTEHAMEHRAR